jgi:hypothetical protein
MEFNSQLETVRINRGEFELYEFENFTKQAVCCLLRMGEVMFKLQRLIVSRFSVVHPYKQTFINCNNLVI